MRHLAFVGGVVLVTAAVIALRIHRYDILVLACGWSAIGFVNEICYSINNIGRNQPQKFGHGSVK